MGIFSKLFSSPKSIDDIFDKDTGLLAKTGGWIGNMNFTDEERAELDVANAKAIQQFVIATLDESTDRSRARRDIAVHFVHFYTLMLFMCGMTYPFNPEWSVTWFNLSTSLAVGGLVTSISVFFFGSHAMAKHAAGRKQ